MNAYLTVSSTKLSGLALKLLVPSCETLRSGSQGLRKKGLPSTISPSKHSPTDQQRGQRKDRPQLVSTSSISQVNTPPLTTQEAENEPPAASQH